MIKLLLYIFILTFFAACSPSRIHFTKDDIFENHLLKFPPPMGGFFTYVKGFRGSGTGYERLNLNHLDIPGVKYDVDIDIHDRIDEKGIRLQRYQKYFKPNFNWDKYFNEELVTYAKSHKEQNMKFYKQEVTYFRGLKCKQVSFSRSGGYAFGYASKNYTLQCGYYTTNGEKVGLAIVYTYSASISNDSPYKMTKDINYKGKYYPIKAVEDDFKSRVKYMIDRIELKTIDIDRMKKEGLYYEGRGREFKPPIW